MSKPLMGGLLLALVLLITVILITVVVAMSPSETSAVQMERPWMDGDYKCGKINWAIVRVDGDLQVIQYVDHHYYHHNPY